MRSRLQKAYTAELFCLTRGGAYDKGEENLKYPGYMSAKNHY